MKNISLLLWLTQLGIILGAYCAIEGFHSSLKNLQRMAGGDKPEQEPPVSFNDHE